MATTEPGITVTGESGRQSAAFHGGWCWFHSPRTAHWQGATAIGLVTQGPEAGTGLASVALVRPEGHEVVHVAGPAKLDDHCVPAVVRDGPDLVVGWTGHATDSTVRLARVRSVGMTTTVEPIAQFNLGVQTTYVSLLPAPDGMLRVATRAGRMAHVVVDVDRSSGQPVRYSPLVWTARDAGDPLRSGRDGGRPYVIHRSDSGRAWFVATDDHPRAYRSGVWCGFIEDDVIHDSEGRAVRALEWRSTAEPIDRPDGDAFEGLSCVVPRGGHDIPWVHDLALAPNGSPGVALSLTPRPEAEFRAARDVAATDIEYAIARTVGDGTWEVRRVASAGSSLCVGEGDYAGGISFHPDDPEQVVLSSDAELDGEGSRGRHRVFLVDLHGQEPRFRVLGDVDRSAIRPLISPDSGAGHVLAFLEGTYSHYTNYDLAVSVIPFTPGISCWNGPEGHVDLPYAIGPDDGMSAESRDLLRTHLADATTYLEYGAGTSTLLALRESDATVISIESDRALIRAIRAASGPLVAGSARLDVRDRGWPMSGAWGYPLGGDIAEFGRAYVEAGGDADADLVLIDGRYRVACFLHLIARATTPTTILWDDYRWRAPYHVVERYARPTAMHGHMAVFEIDAPVDVNANDYASALGTPG